MPRWCVDCPWKARIGSGFTLSLLRRWPKSMAPLLTRQNCSDFPTLRGAKTVQISLRQSLEIEETLVRYELWMTEARQSFARYQQFQPHRRLGLGMAVRLIGLAVSVGREVKH